MAIRHGKSLILMNWVKTLVSVGQASNYSVVCMPSAIRQDFYFHELRRNLDFLLDRRLISV